MLHAFFAWLVLAAAVPAAVFAEPGTITKYVFPDGRVVYSDRPVPGAKAEKEIVVDVAPPVPPARPAPPADAAPEREPIGPVIAESRQGICHVWVEGEGEVFGVNVEGLEPGESIEIESRSNGETLSSTGTASAEGTYGFALFPAVLGKTSGTTTVSLASSQCRLMVTFPWRY